MFGVARDEGAEDGDGGFEDFFDHKPISAAVTLWFVSAEEPETVVKVLRAEPKADRGFGRKYLAQLRPAWPVTSIGDFPLNRSSAVGRGEFYIAGFPGVTVVQTILDGTQKLSAIDQELLSSIPAHTIYAIARNPQAGFGGYAFWKDGELVRAFSALRTGVVEEIGLPEPFEGAFWAGEHSDASHGGINLPFDPIELADSAEDELIGVGVNSSEVDVNVAAFAVDGRPAARPDEHPRGGKRTYRELAHDAASALGLGPDASYDDYEEHPESDGEEFARLAEAAQAAGKRVVRGATRRTKKLAHKINEAIRHSDRG